MVMERSEQVAATVADGDAVDVEIVKDPDLPSGGATESKTDGSFHRAGFEHEAGR